MIIIVTGASRGIGYQLVKALAAAGNCTIFAISRNGKPLMKLKVECESISGSSVVVPIEHNLSGDKSIDWMEYIGQSSIDVCVNNAGCLVNKPFVELDEAEIWQMVEVNFVAAARLIQSILPYAGKPCHIVNIGSMGGFQGSAKFPGLSVYSATKAALASLTECLAEELKEQKIACNCLALGAVNTEMLSEAFPGYIAPTSAEEMARFIANFALEGHRYFNGKVLPVSLSTP